MHIICDVCEYFADVPSFGEDSRIFELDDCKGFGKVCIVYHNTKPGHQIYTFIDDSVTQLC